MQLAEFTVLVTDDCFTILTTPSRKFVDIRLWGYWDKATLGRFAHALNHDVAAVLAKAGCAVGDHVACVDAIAFPVQSQEISSGLSGLETRANAARKTAVILQSALLKLQVQRITPSYNLFERREDAMDWLLAP